ncbi:transcriptional regulator of acetoin/glycerol metabolism [Rhodococcus wratislaviensis]|uniref:Transcriptional regulator n=1 Tax=Rhodococcus wratislaviensis TaxID=44752 RepID=A0AB38FCZ9_RHOWR|nr:helix-turn-helix domain-containing protein [Rhodococcus wratislaviensis]REE75645.1 transcriptional regulator of acetoin/glycerol metabolism [Rhodococcus wratislaviensis]SPZ39318.1 transcriptional regulator [Rhodococcus wratislaviensis]
MEKSRREDEVRSARELLITQGLVRASVPASLVAEEIEQSWRRSVSHRVDPGVGPHILGEIDPDSAILRAAGRILDQWQTNLTDSRMTLFLADEDGRIVSRRIVDTQDERALDQANAVEGFDFSEQSLGTNGLGTPIESRGIVFVRGTEHFNDALAQLACAGAPIKHPITGRIVGSLSIASHIDVASPLMVAMVRQAGHQIAEALELMADSRDLELARTYRLFRSSRHPVLVMNSETVMTDLPALAHFDAESHADLWEKLRRHRWDQDELQVELPTLGAEAMVRRLGRAGQDAIFALEFTSQAAAGQVTVADSQDSAAAPAGGVAVDGVASHRTRPTPYSDVQRQLTASADVEGLIRVVGGPGTGKRHQASRWLRQHTSQEPEVVAVRDLAADDAIWAGGEAALREGRGVVVVGGGDLSDDLRARLGAFARLSRPGAPAGARVILTERAGDANEDGADADPPVVRVPALTELRDELPDIVRAVAAELFPGAPALRFSPAALQCLLAWRWPGNVAELSRLLTAFPYPVRSGLIQTKDLPAPMRQTAWSSLSRYEQAERETIEGALREADGNKARAAKILGIGRTTLYRKMRALKIDADERMIAPGP